MKPKIGLVPLYDFKLESYWMLPGYMRAIEKAGGIPLMLPLTNDKEIIYQLADELDGFIFTGGQDLNPKVYNEKKENFCKETCDKRDEMEALLFKEVYSLDKSALGICRGLQFFNSILGGSLYQDIPSQYPTNVVHSQKPPYSEPVHNVKVIKDSLLYSIVNKEVLKVNSCHHQGIKELSNEFKACAISEDGIIEGIEISKKKFFLGVQWHPEFSYENSEVSLKIFEALITSCI